MTSGRIGIVRNAYAASFKKKAVKRTQMLSGIPSSLEGPIIKLNIVIAKNEKAKITLLGALLLILPTILQEIT